MRKKLIAGNWKMYKSFAEAETFLSALAEQRSAHELVIFCQAPLLNLFRQNMVLAFGPQNIHWEEKGAFTGELSPKLARDMGCTYALAGHSERRQFFGETNESAAKRALAAHQFGMRAVFCLGESLADRDAGQTFARVAEHCAALFHLAPQAVPDFCFAYEPVWAIGTGRTATAQQAQEAHHYLRDLIAKNWGKAASEQCRILYGGSVKPDNAKELLSQPDIDGLLIGGASLEASSFLAIASN